MWGGARRYLWAGRGHLQECIFADLEVRGGGLAVGAGWEPECDLVTHHLGVEIKRLLIVRHRDSYVSEPERGPFLLGRAGLHQDRADNDPCDKQGHSAQINGYSSHERLLDQQDFAENIRPIARRAQLQCGSAKRNEPSLTKQGWGTRKSKSRSLVILPRQIGGGNFSGRKPAAQRRGGGAQAGERVSR